MAEQQAAEEKKRIRRRYEQTVLAMIGEGKVPDYRPADQPFQLQKNEYLVHALNNVRHIEVKTRRQIVGRSRGQRVRVMKGVHVRVGESAGHHAEWDEHLDKGSGMFAVSSKHVLFDGQRTFRIPYSKIVSAEPMGSQIEIVRDRASGQPEYYAVGEDEARFVSDLIHALSDADFGRGGPEIQNIDDYRKRIQ